MDGGSWRKERKKKDLASLSYAKLGNRYHRCFAGLLVFPKNRHFFNWEICLFLGHLDKNVQQVGSSCDIALLLEIPCNSVQLGYLTAFKWPLKELIVFARLETLSRIDTRQGKKMCRSCSQHTFITRKCLYFSGVYYLNQLLL